jgi:anti-anti-sigma regulatory factor
MAKKNENSLIGYDPLAWMHSDEAPVGIRAENLKNMLPEPKVVVVDVVKSQAPATQQQKKSDAAAKLLLQSSQTIQNVTQLHQQLIALLDNTDDAIEIDASAVNVCDTATLQLFVVLKQHMGRLKRTLVFSFPSDKFIEAAELLGITALLGVDKPTSGFF